MEKSTPHQQIADLIAQLQPSAYIAAEDLQDLKNDLGIGGTPAGTTERGADPPISAFPLKRIKPEVLVRRERVPSDAPAPPEIPDSWGLIRRDEPNLEIPFEENAPLWAAGIEPTITLGPFLKTDQVATTYQLYQFRQPIRVLQAGIPAPLVSFLLPTASASIPAQLTYNMQTGGTVLLALRAFDATQAANLFAHLKYKSGTLTFNRLPTARALDLTIDAATSFRLTLELDIPALDEQQEATGIDAALMQLQFPERVTFDVANGKAVVREAADIFATFYGSTYHLTRNSQAPYFYKDSNRLIIPYDSETPDFAITDCRSTLVNLGGISTIVTAGWALPIVQVDTNEISDSKGPGGIFLEVKGGIQLRWAGLQGGTLTVSKQRWLVETGFILLQGTALGNNSLGQVYQLWEEEQLVREQKVRSEIQLRYNQTAPLYYLSLQEGQELISIKGAASANIEKPVATDGMRLKIETTQTAVLLSDKQGERTIIIGESQLINTWRQQNKEAQAPHFSIALHNALFKVLPADYVLLRGKLESETALKSGEWLMDLPINFAMPTLPDPYVTNFLPPSAREQDVVVGRQYLRCGVKWEAPDQANLYFKLEQRELDAVYPFQNKRGNIPPVTDDRDPNRPMLSALDTLFRRSIEPTQLRIINNYETTYLLDVSSNADRWGVGIDFSLQQNSANPNNPISVAQIAQLDVVMPANRVRAFLLPQHQWEPVKNIGNPLVNEPNLAQEVRYQDDGWATLIGTQSVALVPLAPREVTQQLIATFQKKTEKSGAAARFTLPFGMVATAQFKHRTPLAFNDFWATLDFNQPTFTTKGLNGGLQVQAISHFSKLPIHIAPAGLETPEATASPSFPGRTYQTTTSSTVNPVKQVSILGETDGPVHSIFNNVFFNTFPKVPLERVNFAGYGASVFSKWEDPNAAVADVSQVIFNTFVGRTALEIVQVRSILFPYGVRVVRTITMERQGNAVVTRYDSGWQAVTSGVFDFSYKRKDTVNGQETITNVPNPYSFHPGAVHGIYNVSNIRDTPTTFEIDKGLPKNDVILQGVYFDGDMEMSFVEMGGTPTAAASRKQVPSRGQFGFIQISPSGVLISKEEFQKLLQSQGGTLGGPVDCLLNIGNTGQKMRVSRVDVGFSDNVEFVPAPRGSLVLPNDGSWSTVKHLRKSSGAVVALAPHDPVPLIQKNGDGQLRFADPIDLWKATDPQVAYGILQSTDTQKVLFANPFVKEGAALLQSEIPRLADAYRLCKSNSLFPDPNTCLPLNDGWTGGLNILANAAGLQGTLEKKPDPNNPAEKEFVLYKNGDLKIYIEYQGKEGGDAISPSDITVDINSAAALIDRWKAPMKKVALSVDLWIFKPLVTIYSDFESGNGAKPGFKDPKLKFGKELDPFVKMLQMLASLNAGKYADVLKDGLDIAMSNAPDSWDYKFHAALDIPLIKFPPDIEPMPKTPPLILEIALKLGVYYNERFPVPGRSAPPAPSHGAYVELTGILHVQLLTLAVAAAYAVGQVTLGAYMDVKSNELAFRVKMGFGVEIIVSIPVIGTVSVQYLMGMDFVLSNNANFRIGAFLQIKGRVELLAGLISAELMIEAAGYVENNGNRTDCIATLTFSIHISILFICNINIGHSWQENVRISESLPGLD